MAIVRTVSCVTLTATLLFAALTAHAAEKTSQVSVPNVYSDVLELPIASGGLKLEKPLKVCRVEAKLVYVNISFGWNYPTGNPLDKFKLADFEVNETKSTDCGLCLFKKSFRYVVDDRNQLKPSDEDRLQSLGAEKTGEVGYVDFIAFDPSKKVINLEYQVDFNAAASNGILRWRKIANRDTRVVSVDEFDSKQKRVPKEIEESVTYARQVNFMFQMMGSSDRVSSFGFASKLSSDGRLDPLILQANYRTDYEHFDQSNPYWQTVTWVKEGHLKFIASRDFYFENEANPTASDNGSDRHMVAPQIEFDCY